jgi:Fe-S cluster assembly iron-binding protein IscA
MRSVRCSPEASALVTRLVRSQAGLGPEAGLRLAVKVGGSSLHMALAAGPHPGDEVVEGMGCRLFLDPYARLRTQDMLLDCDSGAAGQVFVLRSAEELRRRDVATALNLRRYLGEQPVRRAAPRPVR